MAIIIESGDDLLIGRKPDPENDNMTEFLVISEGGERVTIFLDDADLHELRDFLDECIEIEREHEDADHLKLDGDE